MAATLKTLNNLTKYGKLFGLQNKLNAHPVFKKVLTQQQHNKLAETDVFVAWSNTVLLKTIQLKLSGGGKYWTPPANPIAVDVVNCLNHENEKLIDTTTGNLSTPYELQFKQMEEMGANSQAIRTFLKNVSVGRDPKKELQNKEIPLHVRQYVSHMLTVVDSHQLPYLAGMYVFGKSNLFWILNNQNQNQLNVQSLSFLLLHSIAEQNDRQCKEIEQGGLAITKRKIALLDAFNAKIFKKYKDQ